MTTRYAYDTANRLCRVVADSTPDDATWAALVHPCTDAISGSTTTNVSTRYTYDGVGNLASMVDAANHTTGYGYGSTGELTSTTDALGKTIVFAYNGLGQRIRQENRSDAPLTASVTWTYDGAGRILTRVADSVTTTYSYDASGNKLTAGDGTFTISSTYDRLNRVLTVDDEDAGTTADTTYTYSLTSPSWTDPTGTYGVTLDAFDHPTVLDDPVNATDFITTYRADGQPATIAAPNGNTTTYSYDPLGHATAKNTTAAGPVNRALYAWTYNRAGQALSEASTITADPANGTVTYGYDRLGRIATSALAGTTTTYGWDTVPNRLSVQVGAGATATTAYDGANRPTSGTNPSAAYASDGDGRLTGRPGQTFVWDALSRLKTAKDAAGSATIATYSYDPLDRLRMVDYGGGVRTRFRYVGLTTSVAQLIDDATGSVTLNVGTGWTGERLLDWTGSGSNIRIYGENAHHDVTWLASSTGTVSQSLRYDPWGSPRSTVPTGYVPFRFQGSFYDAITSLSWVVTRWYAPSLGRFISEDSLLGDTIDPPSRHLYAYGQGEPIGRWDPDGRWWYEVKVDDTLRGIATRYLGANSNWAWIFNRNRARISNPDRIDAGWCIWIPTTGPHFVRNQCDWGRPFTRLIDEPRAMRAARLLGVDLRTLTLDKLLRITKSNTGRGYHATLQNWFNEQSMNGIAALYIQNWHGRYAGSFGGMTFVVGNAKLPFGSADATTIGNTVFVKSTAAIGDDALMAHEFIHVLQADNGGLAFGASYLYQNVWNSGTTPDQPFESLAYLWGGYIDVYGNVAMKSTKYGDNQPWCYFEPVNSGWDYCP